MQTKPNTRKENVGFVAWLYGRSSKQVGSSIFPFSLSRFSLDLKGPSYNAMLIVKDSKPLINHLLRMIDIVVGKRKPYWVKVVVFLLKRQYSLIKSQGLVGYVKHLKVSCIVIQQVIAGHREHDLTPHGPRISRSKGGLPRMLPSELRSRISKGDTVSIKVVLTIFSLFRAVVYSADPKFSTITSDRVGSMAGERFLYRFIPKAVRALASDFIGKSLPEPELFSGFSTSPNTVRSKKPGEDEEFATHPRAVLRSAIALQGYFPETKAALIKMIMFHPNSRLA